MLEAAAGFRLRWPRLVLAETGSELPPSSISLLVFLHRGRPLAPAHGRRVTVRRQLEPGSRLE